MDDVLDLPFPDASFDVIWSKHLLQWVSERTPVLAEFVRVSKPGGRIICCNFDGFFLSHFPTNPKVQQDVERWALQANADFGFDNNLARKLPSMFKQAGLTDIKINIIADKAFSDFGGNEDRAWNWQAQWQSAMPFSTRVFGGQRPAEEATGRILKAFDGPDVFVYTTLFYVEGTVPEDLTI